MEQPLVSICSITYNHAPYIRKCLDGFLMQKTDFPFEVIINDDCSTDGTTEIIREYAERYPEVIKPIFHDQNLYSQGVRGMYMKFLFPQAKGRYVAICDGDDYWTDPLKLQKQVDYLEANPECGLVHTHTKLYKVAEGKMSDAIWGEKKNSFRSLLKHNGISTLTVMVRSSLLESYRTQVLPASAGWLMADYPIWLWCASQSEIGFINDITAVYNIQEQSASHFKDDYGRVFDFSINSFDIALWFATRFLSERRYWKSFINRFFKEYYRLIVAHDLIGKIQDLEQRIEANTDVLSLVNAWRYRRLKRLLRVSDPL